MRSITARAAALMVAALAATPALTAAAPMDAQGKYDIGELLEKAEAAWNMEELDAVVLLDRESVTVDLDGEITTRVHRIVWMATELGLNTYADLRVPWNTETSELEVMTLRTWRDGRWWPHENEVSETAVVQTIPGSLQRADDYTTIRETMLLHDGVELPCIVETVYELLERPPSREEEPPFPGDDQAYGRYGMWTFRRSDPCVVSRLDITAPSQLDVGYAALNGAPEVPAIDRSRDHGVRYSWEMTELPRTPHPATDRGAADAPAVLWSTWPEWASLGASVAEAFESGVALSEALRDSVREITEDPEHGWSVAREVASLVREGTRSVHYSDRFWEMTPRDAVRTWETAYGHRLDRAVLATALFREAGLAAAPLYIGTVRERDVSAWPPSLSVLDGPHVLVEGEGLRLVYDPESSTMTSATEALEGLATWVLDGRTSSPSGPRATTAGSFELFMELEAGDDGWSGEGFLKARGALSPHADMLGLSSEGQAWVGGLAASVLPGAEVTGWSAVEFAPEAVVCGFDFTYDPGETDALDRLSLSVGDPSGGVVAELPASVLMYAPERESRVHFDAPLEQRVTLVLEPGEHDVVHVPEPASLDNEAGTFALSVEERDDGSVLLTRALGIDGAVVEPEEWPALRRLLLAETHERNRTILLR